MLSQIESSRLNNSQYQSIANHQALPVLNAVSAPTHEECLEQPFFRTLRDTFNTVVVECKESKELYIVLPSVYEKHYQNLGIYKPVSLYVAINRKGEIQIIPLRLPTANEPGDWWTLTLERALSQAYHYWTLLIPNYRKERYEVFTRAYLHLPPVWPDRSVPEFVEIAFKGKIIDRADHPVLVRATMQN